MQLLLLLVLLLRTASSSDELALPEIAKKNCVSHCGGVRIPYPFGVGPNNHCYFDKWYEIECRNNISVRKAKPFLKHLQLEVLNISTDSATLHVMSPVTYFSCKEKQSRPAANLTGSPFTYSLLNSFVAVSCGRFASVHSGPNQTTVAGCTSICVADNTPYYCGSGINCCRTTLPPSVTTFSASIQEQEDERSGNNARADCEDYAFLVDTNWFDNNISNFRAIKGKDGVPVVIEWSLSLEKNQSLIQSFEGFTSSSYIDTFSRRSPNDSTPYCYRTNANGIYNQTWYQCFCPPGFEGNPYLLQPCQDTDECKDSNSCMSLDLNTVTTWNISNVKCKNTVGGHICYSNETGETCELFAMKEVATCFYKSRHHSQLKLILSGRIGAGIGLLLLLSWAWWVAILYLSHLVVAI